jgi:hypothetical protein
VYDQRWSGVGQGSTGSRRRVHDRLIRTQGPLARREHRVLRRRYKPHSRCLDWLLPPPPRLEQDVVTAFDQHGSERKHREGVARIAEGAEEQAQRPRAGASGV